MGKTSIIILVHNQLQLTQSCLLSIGRFTPEQHEIILVDNGSNEETQQWLRRWAKLHPGTTLIVNNRNYGFSGGNNLGLSIASGDYVLLLNNDVIVTPGWLKNMLAALHSADPVGLAGPVSNNVADIQKINVEYNTPEEMLEIARVNAEAHAGETARKDRLIGFCLLLKREVVDRIGALDEGFGSGNFEDDDYCLRAYYSGYEGVIALDSFVHHEGSKTFAGMGIDYNAKKHANRRIFANKWGLEFLPGQVGYVWPDSPAGVAPERCFIPIPDLAATHALDADGVWVDQDATPEPELELIFRANWSTGSLETATAVRITDVLEETGREIALVSTGSVSADVPAFSLTPKPIAKEASEGPLAILMFGEAATRLNKNDIVEIVRRADRLYAPDQAAKEQLVDAGLPEQLIGLLPFGPEYEADQTVTALDKVLAELHGVTPVARLQPLKVEERKKTLLALTTLPAAAGGWEQAALAYAQAFTADDDVTLVIPCREGDEEQVADKLLTLLGQHQIGTDQLADIIVLAIDDDTTALQLTADAIIGTATPAPRARRLLDATDESLREFVGKRR